MKAEDTGGETETEKTRKGTEPEDTGGETEIEKGVEGRDTEGD